MMNKSVMVYIFSKKSMDLKNRAKPARPAAISITVSIYYYLSVGMTLLLIWPKDAKRHARNGMGKNISK